jgi:hypothetical protein
MAAGRKEHRPVQIPDAAGGMLVSARPSAAQQNDHLEA